MNRTITPIAATLALFVASALPSFAQSAGLPQTVMGKFVHQPGDNQYDKSAQSFRHSAPPQPIAQVPAFVPTPGWQPTPRPFRPDPSIEPIAADEPVAPSGFPPLPDRLDLPVSVSWGSGNSGGGGNSFKPSGGPPAPQGTHQHYQHYNPGDFASGGTSGGGNSGGGGGGTPGSSNYYKVGTPPAINVPSPSESFATNSGGGSGNPLGGGTGKGAQSAAPVGRGGGGGGFGLGAEPKLNADVSTTAAPPQAVTINQATTQDLSLPEDEFQRKATPARPTNAPNSIARGTKRVGQRAGQMIMNRAYGMGASMLRF